MAAKSGLLCAAALAVFAATGCAEESDLSAEELEVSETSEVASTEQALQAPTQQKFAKVVANGSGCPLGTASTSISSDGLVFTTTFSNYEINLSPNKTLDSKFCQLAIEVISPPGISYAVSTFSYQGYATLEQGASAKLNALYYFSGIPQLPSGSPKTIAGPFDDSYLFSESITTFDTNAWSPCGAKRDLNIRTTLSTTNNSRKGGYINLAAIDARTSGKIIVKFATRRC
jgi:hypothetical protein